LTEYSLIYQYSGECMNTKLNPIILAFLLLVFTSLACQAVGGTQQPASTPQPQDSDVQETQPPASTQAPTQNAVEPAVVPFRAAQ
jgi:hypothetical protein